MDSSPMPVSEWRGVYGVLVGDDPAPSGLRRLGTDWIDLLLVHWPDHDTPYAEPIAALEN